MNSYRTAASDQQHSVYWRARHARRHWALRSGHTTGAPTLSLGTLQALMGLAAHQARTR